MSVNSDGARGTGHDAWPIGLPAPDAPDQIKDRNGVVVLRMCRRCGCAERELGPACTATEREE